MGNTELHDQLRTYLTTLLLQCIFTITDLTPQSSPHILEEDCLSSPTLQVKCV